MRLNSILFLAISLFLLSCSQETPKVELSNPGFGITETSIAVNDEGIDLPVQLKTENIIKGLQFTLSWDPSIGQVIKPVLTAANPGFTVSTSEGDRGEMKVLIFSMSGDVFLTTEPTILHIPVRITDPDAKSFKLTFMDAIFAGPKAIAYNIPVSHANLKINR